MASTEIPPRKPFLPPPLYTAEARGVAQSRERAPLPIPMFLASLQDEVDRSHRREAFWMSVLVHLVALVVFVDGAKLLPKQRVVVPVQTEVLQERTYTFLVLPPDLEKNVARPPHTSILSDKDRVASSSQPVLDRKVLEHILASSRKGPVSAKTHRLPSKVVPAATSAKPSSRPTMEMAAASPVPIRPGEPQLASVPAAGPAPVPAAVTKPAQVSVVGTPVGASAGGNGSVASGLTGAGSQAASRSNVDVLSDTMGVNFGPYLSQILRAVRANWYSRIPESARAPLMKKGQVSIQFDILKTGQIAAMQVVGTSGDASLDGAAIVGIDQSGPFPPLPPQFQGQYLALRFHFFYNPDTNDPR